MDHSLLALFVHDAVRGRRFPTWQREQQGQYQYQYHQQSLEEQERYHRQQQSLTPSIPPSPAAIQDQPPDVLPFPTDRTFHSQSMNTTDDEETTTLSRETILKIEELERLIYLDYLS
jgi:hypothetical protein